MIAPQNWDEQDKRQVNDKHDVLVMCRRLSEYLAGHHKALSIVRIPSQERALVGAGTAPLVRPRAYSNSWVRVPTGGEADPS